MEKKYFDTLSNISNTSKNTNKLNAATDILLEITRFDEKLS